MAKVAAALGQNKAMIAYYYGSKQGLVEAVARHVSTKLIDEVLGGLDEPPPKRDLDPLAVYLISGLEGLALERLERGETRELGRAREIFVSAAAVAIRST